VKLKPKHVGCRRDPVAISLPRDSRHAHQIVAKSSYSKTVATCSAYLQLDCAQLVVDILFEKTGLSTIVRRAPTVIVGVGNWISFTAHQAVASEVVFGLAALNGIPTFAPDVFDRRGKARSKTSPSLHLTNLDSGEPLQGHVDAHYWAKNPLAHADEFLRRKTTPPFDLLKRLEE
jgi:hypothetical protein